MSEEARTDEEKAQMYQAMLDGANVITSVLDANNEYGNDLTNVERLKKYEVNYASHVAELGRIKDAALKKGAWSAAVNAETNRGKAAGLYIDRKIIKTGKLEDLTELELEAKMKQILDDYSQIIDVTPDPKKIEGNKKKD